MLRTGCADVVRTQTSAGRVATTPISASIIGAMQVQEAMKIIHTEEGQPVPFKTLSGKMWRFEGMTNAVNVYKYSSWKNNCPAHERWDNVVRGENLSANMTIAQILGELKKLLDVDALEINMRNNKFVEKIISDKPEKEFDIRIPESQLDNYISSNEELRKLSYRTLFHKCFIENIDEYFPYMEMSLKEIGIPLFDILQVSTNKGQFFVELSADANYYKL